MNKCEKCGGLHWRTAPCIIRKESTATPVEHIEPRRSANVSLPVDSGGEVLMVSEPASPPKFDKKEWQKIYMREHRKGLRRRAAE